MKAATISGPRHSADETEFGGFAGRRQRGSVSRSAFVVLLGALALVVPAVTSPAALLARRGPAATTGGPRAERLLTQETVPATRILSNPRNLTDQQRQALLGRQVLRGWNIEVAGGMFGPPTTRDVSSMTGLAIPASLRGRYQRGFGGDFATVAQSYDGQVGFLLVPGAWPDASFVADNVPLYWAVSFESEGPAPFVTMDSSLEVRFELQVPTLRLADGETIYLEFNLLFVDQVSRNRIGVITVVFDPRGIPADDSALYELCSLCTNSLWLGTSLGAGKRWVSMLPETTPSQSDGWRGFRPFGLSISARQFEGMIGDLVERTRRDIEAGLASIDDIARFASISSDPRDYRLSTITLGVEGSKAGVAEGWSEWDPASHVGMSARGIHIDRVTPE